MIHRQPPDLWHRDPSVTLIGFGPETSRVAAAKRKQSIYIYIIKGHNFPENFSHSTSPLFIWGKNWVKTLKPWIGLKYLEIQRSWNTSKIPRGFQKVNGTLKPQRRQQVGRCSCACDQGPVGIIHPAPLRSCLAELTSVNIREFTLSIPTPGVYKHHTVHKRITPAGLWVPPTHRTRQKPKNKWFLEMFKFIKN